MRTYMWSRMAAVPVLASGPKEGTSHRSLTLSMSHIFSARTQDHTSTGLTRFAVRLKCAWRIRCIHCASCYPRLSQNHKKITLQRRTFLCTGESKPPHVISQVTEPQEVYELVQSTKQKETQTSFLHIPAGFHSLC